MNSLVELCVYIDYYGDASVKNLHFELSDADGFYRTLQNLLSCLVVGTRDINKVRVPVAVSDSELKILKNIRVYFSPEETFGKVSRWVGTVCPTIAETDVGYNTNKSEVANNFRHESVKYVRSASS